MVHSLQNASYGAKRITERSIKPRSCLVYQEFTILFVKGALGHVVQKVQNRLAGPTQAGTFRGGDKGPIYQNWMG
jgi:hypothetical protein